MAKNKKKSIKKQKTRKNKTKKRKQTKKEELFHYIPKDKKTVWSNDLLGEREVINISRYIAMMKVDNNNNFDSAHSKSVKKEMINEYKKRLYLLVKNSNKLKSIKKFKLNKKKIDDMSGEKARKVYIKILNKN